jgi:hypothetical protein
MVSEQEIFSTFLKDRFLSCAIPQFFLKAKKQIRIISPDDLAAVLTKKKMFVLQGLTDAISFLLYMIKIRFALQERKERIQHKFDTSTSLSQGDQEAIAFVLHLRISGHFRHFRHFIKTTTSGIWIRLRIRLHVFIKTVFALSKAWLQHRRLPPARQQSLKDQVCTISCFLSVSVIKIWLHFPSPR